MKNAVLLTLILFAIGGRTHSPAQPVTGEPDYPRPQLVRKKWTKLNGRSRVTLPPPRSTQRVLLHLAEAAPVLVNGAPPPPPAIEPAGASFDITTTLAAGNEQQVAVQGPHSSRLLSTAWIETVPANYITRVLAETVATGEALYITIAAPAPEIVELELRDGPTLVAAAKGNTGERIWLKPEKPRYWSPADPFLYQLHAKLSTGDEVESYAALRTLAIAKDAAATPRIVLNGKQSFFFGALASGDTDPAALVRMGFNTVRLRELASPRWYAACDRLGLLVWQDIPQTPESESFRAFALAAVEALRVYPSIAVWTLFHEGMGQEAFGLDAARALTGEIARRDATRLVNGGSGWFDTATGHLHDMHFTPGPAMFVPGPRRAVVLGKFGGLQAGARDELRRQYRELMGKLSLYRAMGLSGAIYAPAAGAPLARQFGEEWLATLNRRMLDNSPRVQTLAGGDEPFEFTTAESGAPREGWRSGSGIYGKTLRNIQAGTPWTTPTLRLRRSFEWKSRDGELYLVYWTLNGAALDVKLNGAPLASIDGPGGESPVFLPLKSHAALRTGTNRLTVDARQSNPAAAFELRLVAVDDDNLGFADPEISSRTEYPLAGVDDGKADLARYAPLFSLVRSRRGRPANTPRSVAFIRDMPPSATPEQIYYALLSSRGDGFQGAALRVDAATAAAREESELKIRNIQTWVRQYTNADPVLHATGLNALAFNRKEANVSLLFTPTPEKPRPIDAAYLSAFPGEGDSWIANLKLLIRAAQSHWPLLPESPANDLYAYATFLLGVEVRAKESPVRLAVPVGELEPLYFWPIGDPVESVPPQDLERYKLPNTTLYRRRFSNGLVVVNPGAQTQTLALPAPLMDAATRQLLQNAELPPHSARIFLQPKIAAQPSTAARPAPSPQQIPAKM